MTTPKKDEKQLIVEVVAGRNLVAMDPEGTSDPYVIVVVGNKKLKTKVIRCTLNPSWDIGSVPERFYFSKAKVGKAKEIVFKCMDWDRFKSDDRMGLLTIPISSTNDKEIDGWFPLKPQKSGDIVTGELHIKIKWGEKVRKVNRPVGGNRSKLWKAIKTSDLTTVQTLLQQNKDIDWEERSDTGESYLHAAVNLPTMEEDATCILMALLKHPSVDVNIVDDDGNTCLHSFCRNFRPPGCSEPFKEYIKKGANVNAQNNYGETPLHQAMFNQSVNLLMADLLLQHKADPNLAANNKETPLHYAVRIGRQELVKLLLLGGADTDVAGREGLRPYGLATKLGFQNIAELLNDAFQLLTWLNRLGLGKYAHSFLDEEMYLYILPDVPEEDLAKHVPNKEDLNKIREEIQKDIENKHLSRKESIIKKQQLYKKRDRLRKREDAVRQYLKDSIVVKVGQNGEGAEAKPGKYSWEIDLEDLEFGQSLGRGAFGEVFKGFYKLGKPVAIKVLKSTNTKKDLDEFIKEFNILINVHSPYIVRFYGASLKSKLCMVMEFCERGSLYDVLKLESVVINWELAFKMLEDIVKGILALHNNNPHPILHRDLKTLNVLVTADFSCRVADFGLSRFDTSTNLKTLQTCRGTYAYIAPEVYGGKKYIRQSDVYSIGIMIWEFMMRCITGVYHRPYAEYPYIKADFTILIQAAKNQLRPTIHAQCPESFKKLIQDAWHQEQEDRPDCEQLLGRLQTIKQEYNNNKVHWDTLLGKPPEKSG